MANEPSSIAWRQQRTRWYLCPRCGWETPITRIYRDLERRALWVCKKCQDQTGRRDTRREGRRERIPRLWPKI